MSFILSLIGALNPITKIGEQIAKYKIAAANATTDRAKIEAEERVKGLEARRDVMVAEAGNSKINSIMRAAMAAPVAVLLAKVFIYDKAFGQWTNGTTDALDANLWQVVMAVLMFYFLYEGAIGVSRILKR